MCICYTANLINLYYLKIKYINLWMDLRTNLSINRSLEYEVHSSSLHTLHPFTPHGWWLSKMDSPQQLHAYVWSVIFMVWSTLSINVAVNVGAVLLCSLPVLSCIYSWAAVLCPLGNTQDISNFLHSSHTKS